MSTLSLDNARAPAVGGRNAAGQSISRMAVRQGRPLSGNAWSPDAPEQVCLYLLRDEQLSVRLCSAAQGHLSDHYLLRSASAS